MLVVDDDPTVREVVAEYLARAGMDVAEAADGVHAVELAQESRPDLVVLDLMLPGLDGLEVCRRMRRLHAGLPVVMLTARDAEEDRVVGLELGADDYVTKPFSPRELVLRVQSVLRRVTAAASEDQAGSLTTNRVLVDGDLEVDPLARQARRRGAELALTVREFDLLAHLLAHPSTAFSRETLMRDVWGWEFGDRSTVTVHVRRLREKVEADPGNPVRLVTVWGVGYRWDPDASPGSSA